MDHVDILLICKSKRIQDKMFKDLGSNALPDEDIKNASKTGISQNKLKNYIIDYKETFCL